MSAPTQFTFRPARAQDLPGVVALPEGRREAFWIFPAHSYPVKPKELASNLKKRLDPMVAEADGAVAGFANLYRVVEGESCYVGNLTVAASLRRRGLGAALLARMARLAIESYGVRTVNVSCFNDNLNGLFFYHGQGFAPCALEPLLDWDRKPTALIHLWARAKEVAG